MLGLGDTGLSMARWLARRGARACASPTAAPRRRTRRRSRASCRGVPLARRRVPRRDARAASTWSRSAPASTAASRRSRGAIARGVPVVGDVELFAQALRTHQPSAVSASPKVLAITGTNGKSTVTRDGGRHVPRRRAATTVVAGNIGLPVLDALDRDRGRRARCRRCSCSSSPASSSRARRASTPDAAAMLNLTEDHLDRYDGIDGLRGREGAHVRRATACRC